MFGRKNKEEKKKNEKKTVSAYDLIDQETYRYFVDDMYWVIRQKKGSETYERFRGLKDGNPVWTEMSFQERFNSGMYEYSDINVAAREIEARIKKTSH